MRRGSWFSRLGAKFSRGMGNFMRGRYGSDNLNTALLVTGLIVCLLSFFTWGWVCLALTLLSYLLMGIVIFRMLSRNTYKRYRENRRYLRFWERLKDRKHRFFECPRCHQPVRVPRHKGKIAITCPKCKEKFIKKT